ncbi:unnamed protein product [Caenorhabditis auriculariae]|uniref:non-specific serine/threonine protein kinase n=1 Tax=Caenorhabditis auriculariae TaxID=2777116 RepID=A0A8S1HWC4_9PELO|nr:unnamed protein product [Caenorhabditis auriculariae]
MLARLTSMDRFDQQVSFSSTSSPTPETEDSDSSLPAVCFRGRSTTQQMCFNATTSSKKVARSKDVLSQSPTARASAARRSLNASTSPVAAPRCRSPQSRGPSTSHHSRTTAPVPLRSSSTRSGSSLMAPQHDNRRWSLASLPSTSGYGTPGTGSNSAFSSQYSSSEHLGEMFEFMRMGNASNRFDSNESYPSEEAVPHSYRPRSRSLTSPVKFANENNLELVNRTSVYKERFPKAKVQMEERLAAFVSENAPLSGGASTASTTDDHKDEEQVKMRNRRSTVLDAESFADRSLLRIIGDGATRFLHHQIVEVAADCLSRSRDDSITCSYFCEMSQRLDETLNEAQMKTSRESLTYLSKLVKQLLMIVSRPARLLECLEFDPDEFYHLLEEAEGVVREQLGSGSARVPDLPQYIIGKLGLDRDPLLDAAERAESPPAVCPSSHIETSDVTTKADVSGKGWPTEQRAPREDDFETIRLVSNGAYGAVYLVRHRETRQRFALKKMNKQTLMLRNQVDQVFAERDILTMADNPFVVSFYGSFETRHHLCMLMEYVEGGDCAALLKNAGTLPIDLVRLYVAETVLAIEYLHSYGIVHRDLKPDNLLITAMGHIKLTDFGLSKIGLMNRTTLVAEGYDSVAETQQFKDKQLCGTPEYIAPEVILRQGYGKPVDWWALGVILYEFLVGIVPFFGDSPEDLFSKVITEEVEYPTEEEALLPEAEDLIKQLLEKNPAERLGTLNGAAQLMTHPFFESLDFTSLLRQKAEFVPQLDNEEDTSYFDTRSDRYNHEAESCGEDDGSGGVSSLMFHSFSTASPRHSIASIDPNQMAHLVAAANAAASERSSTSTENRKSPATAQSSEEQSNDADSNEKEKDADFAVPMPSAVHLRRRFSAQRQSNLSTSSSGTTGTGSGTMCFPNATSSTDSSIDASHMPSYHFAVGDSARSPLPRFAISYEGAPLSSTDGSMHEDSTQTASASPEPQSGREAKNEEIVRFRAQAPSPLQLVIPSHSSSSSQKTQPSSSKDTCYVVCKSSASGQLSPGGASVSSASSADIPSPHHASGTSHQLMTSQMADAQLSPAAGSPVSKQVNIRKGPFGFGFTLKSVRVYLAEHSEYYTIEHIVTAVVEGSPAFEAGLRSEDLVMQVNGHSVHNLTHPQLMHRLLSYGNELTLKVTPLATTSIREGAARKTVGKLAKKKPKRPQRRVPLEKKPRKPSALLRRLSGKRTTNDIVPGSSSQKQTFIPRSVSSQDGSILTNIPGTTTTAPTAQASVSVTSPPAQIGDASTSSAPSTALHGGHPSTSPRSKHPTKRMSDVGLQDNRSPLAAIPFSRPTSVKTSTSSASTVVLPPITSTPPTTILKPTPSIAVSPLARNVHAALPSTVPPPVVKMRSSSNSEVPDRSPPPPRPPPVSQSALQTAQRTASAPQASTTLSAAQSLLNRFLPRHDDRK